VQNANCKVNPAVAGQSVWENPHPLGLLHLKLINFSASHLAVFILQYFPEIANFASIIFQFALIFR
jgi:hypothetical protein